MKKNKDRQKGISPSNSAIVKAPILNQPKIECSEYPSKGAIHSDPMERKKPLTVKELEDELND